MPDNGEYDDDFTLPKINQRDKWVTVNDSETGQPVKLYVDSVAITPGMNDALSTVTLQVRKNSVPTLIAQLLNV